MTFEEVLAKVKKSYAKVDATKVEGHVAVQVNISGEGEGALYIEVAEGKVNVEGYEYYDRDATIYTTADTLVKIASFKTTVAAECAANTLGIGGSYEKAVELDKIVKKATTRKAPAKKAEKAAEVVEAKAEEKKAPAKKATTKKAAETKAPAKKATTAKKTTKKAADAE